MSPPTKIRKTDEEGKEGTQPDGIIRFEVDNISTLERMDYDDYDDDYVERLSPEVEVKGMVWRAKVWRERVFIVGLNFLANQVTSCVIEVDAEYTLIHPDSTKNVVVRNNIRIRKGSSFRGFGIMKWSELVADGKGFIVDDKLTVEIRFWITDTWGVKTHPRMDFTDSKEPCHDVALLIDGKKFYASKAILAAHSAFFHSLFFGTFAEKNKDEIELKDLDPEEFHEMLHVIYPSCKTITESSAEYLIKLGDRFQITSLIDRAEQFLIKSRISILKLLKIADQYRLFSLMDHCMYDLETTGDVKYVQKSPIYKDLSDSTCRLLLDRLIQIVD